MPTYEYACDACKHQFDELQSFSDSPLTKCPKCGKKKLRRLFGTGAAVLFKGSGFYQTDYRSESYKSGEKKEADSTKPAETAKPATTADSTAKASTDSAKPAKPTGKGKSDG
jgi:putative FmdB family regulatory protein